MVTENGLERAYATGFVADFKRRLADNIIRLAEERGDREFAVPVVLLLLVDEKNGGDSTAQEVVKRFQLLDFESRDVLNFFFLGWRSQPDGALAFDLTAFTQFREMLRAAGITQFGGNADIFVLDAWFRGGSIELDFENAIHFDLADARANNTIATIGGFLQELITAAEKIKDDPELGAVLQISARLGLATATSSVVDFVLDKWGKLFGGRKLTQLVPHRVAAKVDLSAL